MAIELVYETHSTTVDNETGIATGWLEGELSETGRVQAAELGRRRRDDGLAAVFTSDLGRAIETAEIAFAGSGLPVHQDWRLRECNYGERNGKPVRGARRAGAPAPDRRAVPGRRELPAGRRAHDGLPERSLPRPVDGSRVLLIAHSANRWALRASAAGSPARGGHRRAVRVAGGLGVHAGRSAAGAGLDSSYGQGAGAGNGIRASARAAAAADRLGRRGRARGACRDARQAVDQARGEAVRARPGGADDGSDDARGRGHARQGRGADVEGHPARPVRCDGSVGRRDLRLSEPRADRGRAHARDERQGRVGGDRRSRRARCRRT